MQNRWKSPVLWASMLTLIAFIATTYFGVDEKEFNGFADVLMPVIIALGIINSPTDRGNL